eukprot:COSAG02_NODE_50198_length_322_cov_0.663677_1_plen_33_part_10
MLWWRGDSAAAQARTLESVADSNVRAWAAALSP